MENKNNTDIGYMYRHRFNSFSLEAIIQSINDKWGVCELYMDEGALCAMVEDGQSVVIISRDRCLHSIDEFYDQINGKTEDNE